eukprot:jgi/Ulvmu1/12741/UM095_0046.1
MSLSCRGLCCRQARPGLVPRQLARHILARNALNGSNANGPSKGEQRKPDQNRAKDALPNHLDSLDWGQSIPSYLQSTHSQELCEEWSDAIEEAEAVAAARKKAIEQGRDPEDAELESRKAAKLFRSVSIWNRIRQEAARDIETEPMLSSFLFTSILSHESFGEALAFVLSNRIADETLLPTQLFSLFMTLERQHPEVLQGAVQDLEAVYQRDPACQSYSQALLYFKGYHAIQLYRFSHALWSSGRQVMALLLQSRLSEVLAVDIHPAAQFGRGILLDHGTGVVVGETAIVGNGVSIMQNVTLGGTGKEVGDRHPKIGRNVLVGAGASILGNIEVAEGAQVAAGSLVLKPVQPHTMVAGSPAKEVGVVSGNPAASLKQWSEDCPLEDMTTVTAGAMNDAASAAAQRVSRSRLTGTGGKVRVYSEADYYRHVDAEKHMLNKDPRYGKTGLPGDWRQGAGNGEGAAGVIQQWPAKAKRSEEAKEEVGNVVATTSDADAEKMWGRGQKEPEFYI